MPSLRIAPPGEIRERLVGIDGASSGLLELAILVRAYFDARHAEYQLGQMRDGGNRKRAAREATQLASMKLQAAISPSAEVLHSNIEWREEHWGVHARIGILGAEIHKHETTWVWTLYPMFARGEAPTLDAAKYYLTSEARRVVAAMEKVL